jgi:hypothetical protein
MSAHCDGEDDVHNDHGIEITEDALWADAAGQALRGLLSGGGPAHCTAVVRFPATVACALPNAAGRTTAARLARYAAASIAAMRGSATKRQRTLVAIYNA